MEHDVFAISLTAANDVAASRSCLIPVRASGAVEAPRPAGNTDFIAGPENRLAAAAIDWLLRPAEHAYSPLMLHGPSGTGKSHLAQAVAQVRGDAVYIYAAEFARELAESIDQGAVHNWRTKYRSAGMLVFEDLTQIADRQAAQQELLRTLDELEARHAPVLVTSRLAPAEMAQFPATLRSRLAAGLEVPLSLPGFGARIVILERLAAARGLRLSPGAVRLLATGLYVTAAELRGILLELELEAAALNRKKSPQMNDRIQRPEGKCLVISTQRVRHFLAARRARLRPNLQQVASFVAKYFGLKRSQLCGSSRRQQVALARGVAIYVGRQLTGKSLQALGCYFGGRDHTTILHSYRMLESRLARDRQLRSTVINLRQMLVPGCMSGE